MTHTKTYKKMSDEVEAIWAMTTAAAGEALKTEAQKFVVALSDAQIAERIEARAAARKARDFAAADRIRAEIEAAGLFPEDKAGETIWRRGLPPIRSEPD